MLLAALTLHAGAIDVSSSQSVGVGGGDTLSFELFTGSYRTMAQQFGLPLDPEAVRFAFVTSRLAAGREFSATLRSADASLSLALSGSLEFTAGYYSSSAFEGDISTLQGQFSLDSAEGQGLLRSGTMWLDFRNLGGDVVLGLGPLTLGRELYASLSGGPLSVGAANGAVLLEHPVPQISPGMMVFGPQQNAFTPTPEPGPIWMIVSGGGLLLGVSTALKRLVPRP